MPWIISQRGRTWEWQLFKNVAPTGSALTDMTANVTYHVHVNKSAHFRFDSCSISNKAYRFPTISTQKSLFFLVACKVSQAVNQSILYPHLRGRYTGTPSRIYTARVKTKHFLHPRNRSCNPKSTQPSFCLSVNIWLVAHNCKCLIFFRALLCLAAALLLCR